MKRILITGPSGMGKTTLMNHISLDYKMSSVGIGIIPLMQKYFPGENVSNHKSVIELMKKDPFKGLKVQFELLMGRQLLFGNRLNESFVTDRGHIDSLVYTSDQVFPYLDMDDPETRILKDKFIKKARSIHRFFTHIIFIPYLEGWKFEDNGVRIIDPEYQLYISQKFQIILAPFMEPDIQVIPDVDFGPKVLLLESHDFEQRFQRTKKFIANE